MKQLTSAQQRLVENNHNLIYSLANKSNIDIDEYYGVLAIGLCEAALAYDESKGKFSTFAWIVMKNEYLKTIRHNATNHVIPHDVICSLDTEINIDDESSCNLHDLISDDSANVENESILKSKLDFLYNKLSGYDKEIVTMLLKEIPQSDIAKHFGVSKQYVNQRVLDIRKKFRPIFC